YSLPEPQFTVRTLNGVVRDQK
ncbi:MAG: hypothetical protein RL220_1258, partial [Bacteroidota bacterium]